MHRRAIASAAAARRGQRPWHVDTHSAREPELTNNLWMSAESMERRRGAKGNTHALNMCPTQSRESMPQQRVSVRMSQQMMVRLLVGDPRWEPSARIAPAGICAGVLRAVAELARQRRIAPSIGAPGSARDGPVAYAAFVAEGRNASNAPRMSSCRVHNESVRADRCPGIWKRYERYERYERDQAISEAYADGGHTQTAIAAATGLPLSRISWIISGREAEAIGKT